MKNGKISLRLLHCLHHSVHTSKYTHQAVFHSNERFMLASSLTQYLRDEIRARGLSFLHWHISTGLEVLLLRSAGYYPKQWHFDQ